MSKMWSCKLDESEIERFDRLTKHYIQKTGMVVPKSNIFRMALMELEKKVDKEECKNQGE